jgi:isopenicillin N synthase-like dioxygenase
MHGSNLFPEALPEMRDVVLSYIKEMTRLGHHLMAGLSLSLGLPPDRFASFTSDPLILFRIFHYPPDPAGKLDDPAAGTWGVGEHTDYGLLTILKQDTTGGLQVKVGKSWVEAPPVEGTFVCNIGDMLDRLTGGYYRSTPHRVKNRAGSARLSFPFFFDPDFSAVVEAMDLGPARLEADDRDTRWDGVSVHEFEGTYGQYLLAKVEKVFPDLRPP